MTLHRTVSPKKKRAAVHAYLKGNVSLRAVAKKHKISYRTLSYWVNQYKRNGESGLIGRKTRRHLSKEIETKVMLLKEQNPALSISQAQKLLKGQKITLSRQHIWRVWHRYGLSKRIMHEPLRPFCSRTPETDNGIEKAKHLIQKGDVKGAAQILNNLPCLPRDPVMKQIPERYLSPRRKLDLLSLEFETLPLPQRRSKARRLGMLLESKGFVYSSIIANFHEVMALDWIGKPEEKALVLDVLAKKMRRMKNSALQYLLYNTQAITYIDLLQIDKALVSAKQCRRLVYRLPFSYYQDSFATLLTALGRYADSVRFYKKALELAKDQRRAIEYHMKIAMCGPGMSGDYHTFKKILTKAKRIKEVTGFGSAYCFTQAHLAFGQGNLSQAREYYLESLEKATRGQLYAWLYVVSMGLAAVANALKKEAEATMYLKKYLPLMRKHKLMGEALVLAQLMDSKEKVPKELLFKPTLCLLNLLVCAQQTEKIGDYRKAFSFAKRHRLLGLFHRWIVFFPKPVLHLLEKGKPTGLPRAILRFPIFNQELPVYHVKFLGHAVISKHDQYVRAKPSPQETAFVIHLALRAGAPGKSIPVKTLYHNFWRRSEKPMERLLHLLARIKRTLRIPGHLLAVSSISGETRLINRGVYITTDYAEFETLLTQIKTLKKAGEWPYVRRDYLRAFALLRGEPLSKMYDDWSEHLRRTIISKVEREITSFADDCLKNDNRQDAYKTLTKVQTIAPYSLEVKQLLKKVAP